jgi:hypothetical protein
MVGDLRASRRADPLAWSPEFNLLCAIARPRPDDGLIRRRLLGGCDFDELLRLAAEHGVRPLLVETLTRLSWPHVPTASRAALETFRRLHGLRALALAGEVARLADAFVRRDVRFALVKGPALAASLYGDLAAREYYDLDIVVAEDRVADAEQALASLGYRGVQGDDAWRHAFLSHLRQFAFEHPAVDAAVDLHWHFTGRHLPFPIDPEEIWPALDTVPIGGRDVPTLAGAELALLLAGHGTKERWKCLMWVRDFAMLQTRRPDLDWAAIHRRAGDHGCGNAVLLACAMTHGLLDVPLPHGLAITPRVEGLAAPLIDCLRSGARPRAGDLADIDLCDSAWARSRALLTLALSRSAGDYESLRLPPSLWPVYHLTRPFRLAAKMLPFILLSPVGERWGEGVRRRVPLPHRSSSPRARGD